MYIYLYYPFSLYIFPVVAGRVGHEAGCHGDVAASSSRFAPRGIREGHPGLTGQRVTPDTGWGEGDSSGKEEAAD